MAWFKQSDVEKPSKPSSLPDLLLETLNTLDRDSLILDKNGNVAGRISGAITVASLTSLIEKVSNE